MSPPAMLTGALPFTAFWSALAFDAPSCAVSAACLESCAWPLPPDPNEPQPQDGFEPSDGGADWVWVLLWVVPAPFPAPLAPSLLASWFAALSPPWMLPPATLTGALLLTAFWSAFAFDAASWAVSAACFESCACPLPPESPDPEG